MPVPKIAFKSTGLDLELENVEITVGPEILKVGNLKASLDVADLLRVQLPELMKGDASGVMLISHGLKKIQIIKEIRNMTQWGLREAKTFVEDAETTGGSLLKTSDLTWMPGGTLIEKANKAAETLKTNGASVEVCHGPNERIPTVLDRFREMLVEALRAQVSPGSADG